MRLKAFGVELVFDDLSFNEYLSEIKQIYFITSLVNVDINELPNTLPKIYTSEVLKGQLITLFIRKGILLPDSNFHVLKSFEAERIQIDVGDYFEVLACMPVDMSTSFMLAFRKFQSLKILHLYAGFSTDLSSMMVNTKFAIWLKASGNSIENLHVLNTPTDRCADCETKHAFEDIKQKLNDESIVKVLMHLPLFGYEAFIAKLASTYRYNIAVDYLLYDLLSKVTNAKMQYFIKDFEKAGIVVSMNKLPLAPDCTLPVTVKNTKVQWQPLPDSYELKLLTRLVNPKYITVCLNNNRKVESLSINMSIYSEQTNEKIKFANTSSQQGLCHCAKFKRVSQMVQINHSSLKDCARQLIFAHTDQYQNTQAGLSVEDQLERMFETTTTSKKNNPKQTVSHIADSSRQQPDTTVEQPSCSKFAKETNINVQSKSLSSAPPKPLVYRTERKAFCYDDSTSSSD